MNTKQTLIHSLQFAAEIINSSKPESIDALELAFDALRNYIKGEENYIKAEEALSKLSKDQKQYLCRQVLSQE